MKKMVFLMAMLVLLPSLIYADVIGDSFVYKDANTTNYGGDNNLETAYDVIYSYILINNSICSVPNQTIKTVYLKMYLYNLGEEGNYFVAYNTTPSYTESNITWNTKPAPGILQDNVSKGTVGNFINFNITNAYLTACSLGTNTSILLKWDNDFGSTSDFYSRNYGAPALRPNITILSEPTIIRGSVYCFDNSTLAHINITNLETGNIITYYENCTNGCDSVLNSCSPKPYEVSIIFLVIIFVILWVMYKVARWL